MKTMLLIVTCLWFSIASANMHNSLFSDHKSFAVGDIITVEIAESSRATSSSQSRTDRSQNHNMNVQAGQGPLSFIPLTGMGGSTQNNSKGDANTTRDASLTSRMTVRIVDIDMNGNLIIEGNRTVGINGEDEKTTLSGVIRPRDVSPNNVISSYNIADAKISYSGKGTVEEGSRVGVITRFMNWLF